MASSGQCAQLFRRTLRFRPLCPPVGERYGGARARQESPSRRVLLGVPGLLSSGRDPDKKPLAVGTRAEDTVKRGVVCSTVTGHDVALCTKTPLYTTCSRALMEILEPEAPRKKRKRKRGWKGSAHRRPFPAHREPHPLNRNRGVGGVVTTTA